MRTARLAQAPASSRRRVLGGACPGALRCPGCIRYPVRSARPACGRPSGQDRGSRRQASQPVLEPLRCLRHGQEEQSDGGRSADRVDPGQGGCEAAGLRRVRRPAGARGRSGGDLAVCRCCPAGWLWEHGPGQAGCAGHGPLRGDVRCVAGGVQRHAAAVVRGGLPQRAAVRGRGGGGHHLVDRGRRGHVAGTGQPAAGLSGDLVPDRLRGAELVLCHRQAGHHLGDARRRRHLEQPCAFPCWGRCGPYQAGMPAGSCGWPQLAAVPAGPAGHCLRQRQHLLRRCHRAGRLLLRADSRSGPGRAAECHLDDE